MAHLIILHIVRDHSLTKAYIQDKLRAYSAVIIASSSIITFALKKIVMKLIDNFISLFSSYYTST